MENRDSEDKSNESSSALDGLSSVEVIDSTKSGEVLIEAEESPSIVIISSEDASCDIESPIVISSEENEVQRNLETSEARSFEIVDEWPNLCSTPGPKGNRNDKDKTERLF